MKKGFTLVEMLVVIALIGALAIAAMTALNPLFQIKKARDTQRKTDLAKLQAVLELHRSDQGSYPASPLPSCGSALTVSGTTYIKAIPCDPTTSAAYTYTIIASGYNLIACLENTADLQKDAVDVCGGAGVSYTVTNP